MSHYILVADESFAAVHGYLDYLLGSERYSAFASATDSFTSPVGNRFIRVTDIWE